MQAAVASRPVGWPPRPDGASPRAAGPSLAAEGRSGEVVLREASPDARLTVTHARALRLLSARTLLTVRHAALPSGREP